MADQVRRIKNRNTLPKESLFDTLFGVDLRSLALFRVSLGLIILNDFITFFMERAAFFTEQGVMPAPHYYAKLKHFWSFSLFCMNDSLALTTLLIILGMLATIAFILGWNSRFASFWMWLLLMSMHGRNLYVIKGTDTCVRFLAFWSMFLPLGEKYAWDAPAKNDQKKIASFATMAVMLQLFYIYFLTFYFKALNIEWMKGEGLACALQISDTVRPFGRFLLQYPLLTTSLNHLTLILESVGPFLLFVPVYNQYFRSLAIFLFTSLQAAFGLSLYVMNFPPAMITGSMPFIPSFWWEWIARFKKMQSIGDIVRRLLSRPKILGPAPARGPLQRTVQRFLNGAALFFTCLVLFINLTTMNFGIKLPAFLHPISYGLMLHQVWTAYSPKGHFFNFNNWYVMVGTLKDGTQIDIFRNAAVDWECPEAYCKTYRNSRWSLFLTYATYSGAFNEMNRQHLLRYCSDQWNKRHDSETQVVKVDYYQVTQSIRPKPGPLQKTLLTTYFPFPPANEAAP